MPGEIHFYSPLGRLAVITERWVVIALRQKMKASHCGCLAEECGERYLTVQRCPAFDHGVSMAAYHGQETLVAPCLKPLVIW